MGVCGIILVILIVAFILCSPLGIFYANDTAEGMPMTQAIAQVNTEFYEEIQHQIDYVAQVSDYDAMLVVYVAWRTATGQWSTTGSTCWASMP